MIPEKHLLSNSSIAFNGGNITSDGGSILISSFIDNNNLLDFADAIPFDDERKRKSIHSNADLLRARINRTILGVGASSAISLKNDPLYVPGSVPSASSDSRLLKRVTEKTNNELMKAMTSQAVRYISTNVENPVLDIDSTKVSTFGRQEAAAYIHHYSQIGYHPIVVNEYHTRLLVYTCLRPGNTYSANGTVEHLQAFLPELCTRVKGTVTLRGDSAFSDQKIFDYLEGFENVVYFIRAKNFTRLSCACSDDFYAACLSSGVNPDTYTAESPYYGEVSYTFTKAQKARRICYKAYFHTDKDGQMSLLPAVFAITTNSPCPVEEVIEKSLEGKGEEIEKQTKVQAMTADLPEMTSKESISTYCQRGNSENFTKELKDDFRAGKLSSGKFVQNEFQFLLCGIAYNIFHLFQCEILEGNDQRIRMNTYRTKYQKIGGKITKHARKFWLSLSSAFPFKKQFLHYVEKISEKLLPPHLNFA